MNHTLTDWRRAVCGGGRTAQNARRTCAVRVAQSGGGGRHFREKSALEAAFSALHAILGGGWPRWAAAPSFRAFQQRRNAPAILQGQIFRQKFRLAILQGQIFRQKFRPAVCRDKFSTKNFALQFCRGKFSTKISPCNFAGTNFSPRISPCNFAGTEIWRQDTPIFAETPKKGQRHAPS